MEAVTYISISIYATASIALMLYGLNTYVLLSLMLVRRRRSKSERIKALSERELEACPNVTVQIPIYNECNVAVRVIRAASRLKWNRRRLEIQVLDDSDDETVGLIDECVNELRDSGSRIVVIRRGSRTGFKAGALANGMRSATGEYFAIFDADFKPEEDFLLKAIPEFFAADKVGFVQARWGHLNRKDNLLTRCQALGIDGHFLVEQPARASNNLFMNFNGTAGIWSRSAIEEAGGWMSETLTEDLDLSYRALLAGYKARYRSDVVVPAEIPATISAAKSQQFRWAKGSIQTSILMLPKVFRGKYSLFKKIQAVFHLSNYAVHPCMLALSILALPVLLLFSAELPVNFWKFALIPLLAATFGPSTMYTAATVLDSGFNIRRLLWLPLLIIYGTGIAVSNSLAVFEAIAGRPSSFIRTPKRGGKHHSGYKLKKSKLWMIELAVGLYSLVSIYAVIKTNHWGVLPFVAIFAAGFLLVGLKTANGIHSDA